MRQSRAVAVFLICLVCCFPARTAVAKKDVASPAREWCLASYEAFAAGLIDAGYSLFECTADGWAVLQNRMECTAFHPSFGVAVWIGGNADTPPSLSLHRLLPQYTSINDGDEARLALAIDNRVVVDGITVVHREAGELPRYNTFLAESPIGLDALAIGSDLWVTLIAGETADVWRFNLHGGIEALAALKACAGREQ